MDCHTALQCDVFFRYTDTMRRVPAVKENGTWNTATAVFLKKSHSLSDRTVETGTLRSQTQMNQPPTDLEVPSNFCVHARDASCLDEGMDNLYDLSIVCDQVTPNLVLCKDDTGRLFIKAHVEYESIPSAPFPSSQSVSRRETNLDRYQNSALWMVQWRNIRERIQNRLPD